MLCFEVGLLFTSGIAEPEREFQFKLMMREVGVWTLILVYQVCELDEDCEAH